MTNQLAKVGIFYDGNYFSRVSNYYNYEHTRKSRLSISGLHYFIRSYIAEKMKTDNRLVSIVEAHYFRGRFTTYEAKEANKLLSERLFDDVLMNEGIITHYLPLRTNDEGKKIEKGIDVAMSLDIYELSFLKKFDIVVLVVCDGDFAPLIRKLNSLGVKVMVLAWDFEFSDERTGKTVSTTTSIELLKDCNYPVMMHEIIDNEANQNKSIINDLFVVKEMLNLENFNMNNTPSPDSDKERGMVFKLKDGYGFISKPPYNLFFHWTEVQDSDFNDLQEGDVVNYKTTINDKGQEIAVEITKD
ncbi:MAG TPA: NYN domain-containing protein [Chitinophagales bacterium]|nr:NYN domain-containing protein [Chitinophagales bacterium]